MLTSSFGYRDYAKEILANGGGTFIVQRHNDSVIVEPAKLADGFMVSQLGTERIIPADEFCEWEIGEFIGDNFAKLTKPRNYLGAWVFEGNVYLDVSDHWDDSHSALGAGAARQQLAIFDNSAQEAIAVA